MDLFIHVSLFNLFSVYINYFHNKTAGKDDITVHYTKIKLKCFHPESIFNTFKVVTLTVKDTVT